MSAPAAAPTAASAAGASWSDKLRAVDRLSPARIKHNNEVVFFV
jgi:hypothetical protein